MPDLPENSTELPSTADAWLHLLKSAREAAKEAKADEELAKRNLLELLGGAEAGTLSGRVVCTNKTAVRTTVNQDQLREEFPEAYEKCLRSSEVTTFRVVAS